MYWHLVLAVSFLKLLLLPYYTSTDFEVHRNWLAITHSLPLSQWYTEATSEWTLDYPPFFAWFEWMLSQAAVHVDPKMLEVSNLEYKSFATLAFQRVSVIVSDLVLAGGVVVAASNVKLPMGRNVGHGSEATRNHLGLLVLTNAGLLMVDHIHFQYNGLLLGLLLASVGLMLGHRFLASSLIFVVLLNMKHIFIYCALPYFVYLLSTFCYPFHKHQPRQLKECITNIVGLGVIVISGFALSIGPFVYNGTLGALLARLFPFKRGLTHAYWAPNFWALYSAADRLLVTFHKMTDPNYVPPADAKVTSGLVQDSVFAHLPQVTPLATFTITVAALTPIMMRLWNSPKEPIQFLRAVILSSFTFYMFSWHVHEKAILLVTIPWTLLVVAEPQSKESRAFIGLTTLAHVSIFPLLFRVEETLVKVFLAIFHISVCLYVGSLESPNPGSVKKGRLSSQSKKSNIGGVWQNIQKLFGLVQILYLTLGSIVVILFPAIFEFLMGNTVGLQEKYQFLPLMAYSVFCAVGNVFIYFSVYFDYAFRKL